MPRPLTQTYNYGPLEHQSGDLYLPKTPNPAVLCLVHGGFWRMPYNKDELEPIALDLAKRGYAAWNLEYRRVGGSGGGWPGTLQDVAMGIDFLKTLVATGADLDLKRVVVVGHSAGGQLALWAAARNKAVAMADLSNSIKPLAVAGLAPVANLKRAYALNLGRGAVRDFIGGSPDELPERYSSASPIDLLPLGTRHLILHGTKDEFLPVELSQDYAKAAKKAGDTVDFIELPLVGHLDFLDPSGDAHAALCHWLSNDLDLR